MNRGIVPHAPGRSARDRAARHRRVQRRRRQGAKTSRSTAPVVAVAAAAAVEQPIARFIRATGTLMAEEQADVAAETAGRVVATPVERGTQVAAGRRARAPVVDRNRRAAQGSRGERRADRSAARPRRGGAAFDVNAVPEVQNAKAALRAGAERVRPHQVAARSARRLAVGIRPAAHADGSGAPAVRVGEERRRAAVPVAAGGARPRRARAQGARRHRRSARRSPASSRERLVSVGDYVTKGMKVAVVVRVNPLRVQLTVPEQFVSAVAVGQPVTFEVDAYPGRQFEGQVRYVSPSLRGGSARADGRSGRAEPERRAQAGPVRHRAHRAAGSARRACSCRPPPCRPAPAPAACSSINGDHVEERIVTIGQTIGELVEITKGLKAGERVATQERRRSSPTAVKVVRKSR